MVAGELPADPTQLSPGHGPVTIDGNVIQANLANDDGGGIRLLQASGSHVSRSTPGTISITNNTVANNVSAHEGGGIALDDAAFVNIVDNTVTKNLTTATAVTSDGDAAPAGLSTAANSDPLQARLRSTRCSPAARRWRRRPSASRRCWTTCSADNRAGTFNGGYVTASAARCPTARTTASTTGTWASSDGRGPARPGRLGPADHGRAPTQRPEQHGHRRPRAVKDPYAADGQRAGLADLPGVPPGGRGRRAPAAEPDGRLPPRRHRLAGVRRGAASTTVRWGAGPLRWSYTVAAPAVDIDGDERPRLRRTPLRRRLRPADAVTDRWPAPHAPCRGHGHP